MIGFFFVYVDSDPRYIHVLTPSFPPRRSSDLFSYSPSRFKAPHVHPLTRLGAAGGLSGFRLMNKGNIGDWLAFQGASYFRSAGPLHQYGLSARGIAID